MSYTELKGFSYFNDNVLDDQLRANLLSFFTWGFLNKSAYQNVRIPTSGQYGEDKSRLQLVKDERYTYGKVWQAFKTNLVWESGVNTPTQPIQVSGVYVDNIFRPLSGVGPHSHQVDYNTGRVVFNSAISTSSSVKMEYSYRDVQIRDSQEVPFIRQLQTGSFRLDQANFNQSDKGDTFVNPENKIQSPCVVFEVTSNVRFRPYQVGGGQYARTKVIAHVMSDNDRLGTKIASMLSMQNEKAIETFDVSEIAKQNLSPLDSKGSIRAGALTHPQMVEQYRWKKMILNGMEPVEGQWLSDIFYIPVKFYAEVILNNI